MSAYHVPLTTPCRAFGVPTHHAYLTIARAHSEQSHVLWYPIDMLMFSPSPQGIALKAKNGATAEGNAPSLEEALAEFGHGGSQPVLLDDSLKFNLLSRVSVSAVTELRHEASVALLLLEHDARDGFTPLMLHAVPAPLRWPLLT